MSGTKAGGAKTRRTIYRKYGTDYFAKLGRKGGKVPREHYAFRELKKKDPELLKRLSAKGGRISRKPRITFNPIWEAQQEAKRLEPDED